MDNRAVALKLILGKLDIDDISTVERRMEVQKAVYLTQSVGVSLGYTYGWYLKGPYSPALTRDYYSLADEAALPAATLKPAAAARVERVSTLMERPIGSLARPQRLELLASLHYLLKESGLSKVKARERIADTKPYLLDSVDAGLYALEETGLL